MAPIVKVYFATAFGAAEIICHVDGLVEVCPEGCEHIIEGGGGEDVVEEVPAQLGVWLCGRCGHCGDVLRELGCLDEKVSRD